MHKTKNTLNYRISGNGDPVVFLHGFMEDLSMWDNIVANFQHKTCILIDLHGHGASFFDPTITPSIREMAQQVQNTIQELGIEYYQLVGHSLGGYVGCEILRTDDQLEHLTLLHSQPWADSDMKKNDRNRVIELVKTKAVFFIREAIPALFAYPNEHKKTIQVYCQIAERMNPEAIAWTTMAMRDRLPANETLANNAHRVSIIQGQLDQLIPHLKVQEFSEASGIAYYEIQNCGHMGQEEKPNNVNEVLKVILG